MSKMQLPPTLAAAALGFALLCAGCGKEAQTAPPKGMGMGGPPEVGVQVVEPQRVAITTELPGRTSAFLVAEVRPQVGGIVRKRLFTEGADVRAGEVLYEIDPSSYQAAYANAQAAVAKAKANLVNAKAARSRAQSTLANAKAGAGKARAALATAKASRSRVASNRANAQAALNRSKANASSSAANLARAEANAVPIRLKAKRFKELVALNAVSQQDADEAAAAVPRAEADIKSAQAAVSGSEAEIASAEAALQAAEADISGSEAAVTAAEADVEGSDAAVQGGEAGIESADAAVKSAEAEITGAEAMLETARINLAYTRVTAPISGRIGRSAVTTGALVTANQATALAVIQQLDSVYVDLTQSTASLLRLKQSLARGELHSGGAKEAQVKLVLEDGSPYPLTGRLKFSDVTVDPSTGSVTLRTVFPNPSHLLLPGMYVRAVLEEGVNDRAILVPQRGVTRNPAGRPLVMVVGAGDKVEPRVITAERTVGESWLVTEGLQPGDRVILEGLQKAKPGTPVKVVPFGAPPAAGPSQLAAAKK